MSGTIDHGLQTPLPSPYRPSLLKKPPPLSPSASEWCHPTSTTPHWAHPGTDPARQHRLSVPHHGAEETPATSGISGGIWETIPREPGAFPHPKTVTARILPAVSCEAHPGAAKLSPAQLDWKPPDGGAVASLFLGLIRGEILGNGRPGPNPNRLFAMTLPPNHLRRRQTPPWEAANPTPPWPGRKGGGNRDIRSRGVVFTPPAKPLARHLPSELGAFLEPPLGAEQWLFLTVGFYTAGMLMESRALRLLASCPSRFVLNAAVTILSWDVPLQ